MVVVLIKPEKHGLNPLDVKKKEVVCINMHDKPCNHACNYITIQSAKKISTVAFRSCSH